MKIQVKIEQNGNEIINSFITEAKKSNVDVEPNKVLIIILSKEGKELSITPDRLKLVFNQE